MEEQSDKKLKFLREMEKMRLKAIKDASYKSPLEGDAMVFKGPELEPEVINRINVGTEKIDTKSPLKVLSGTEFRDKIEALTKKNKPSGSSFAQTKAKMIPSLSGLGVGADLLQGDVEKAADAVAGDVLQSTPSMIAKGIGKLAPKAAGIALKAANPLGMLIGEALGSEKAGEGSDQSVTEAQARDVELVREAREDDDTLNTSRFKALQRMMGK
jgi:hypothetical protein